MTFPRTRTPRPHPAPGTPSKRVIQKQIEIAAKLYRARDAMKRFWRSEYAAKIAEHQGYIRMVMNKLAIDEFQAMMKLVECAQKNFPGNSGMAEAMLISAYVEMIEPSE